MTDFKKYEIILLYDTETMTIEKVKFMSERLSSLINMLNKKVCKCNL